LRAEKQRAKSPRNKSTPLSTRPSSPPSSSSSSSTQGSSPTALPGDGTRFLTPYLRRKLKKPLGRLFPSAELRGDEFISLLASSTLIVAVGDRVTETIQETMGRSPDVFVVDGVERRVSRGIPNVAHASAFKARNPPGSITMAASSAIRRAFLSHAKPVMVEIDGEEDLLAIPAVIEAPEDALVLYGQPQEGVVAIKVDESSRRKARELLRRMLT
jgi:uncharacterized protein (UPF0218 family)